MIDKLIGYLKDRLKEARDAAALEDTTAAFRAVQSRLRDDLRDWVDYLEANDIEEAKKRIRELEGEVAGLEARIRAFKNSTGGAA